MIFLFFFLALLPTSAPALDTLRVTSPDPILESWRWTPFDHVLKGKIRAGYEDRDGNMWFFTDTGRIQRYDGLNWTTIEPRNGITFEQVRVIHQTRDGAMWFGTNNYGAIRFDGKNWTAYTTADGLASDYFLRRGLFETSDGTLWAGAHKFGDKTGSQSGISRFDGNTWTPIDVPVGPPRPPINDIFEGRDGEVWFTTQGFGVLRFDGTNWTRYTQEDALTSNAVGFGLKTDDGDIWVTCFSPPGISRFDGKQWRIYTSADGLPPDTPLATLWRTRDGTLWAGAGDGTMSRFDGIRWNSYNPDELPQLGGIVFGLPSRDGSVWIGSTLGDKIFRFDPGTSTVFTHPLGLSGGLETADGSLWFRTGSQYYAGPIDDLVSDRGLAVQYQNGMWLGHAEADGFLAGPALDFLQTSDGSLWYFGTHHGEMAVARFVENKWTRYTVKDGLVDRFNILVGHGVGHPPLVEAQDGTLWIIGQYQGDAALSRFDGKTWRRHVQSGAPSGDWATTAYTASDGSLWVGTVGPPEKSPGLFRFDGRKWRRYGTLGEISFANLHGFAEWPKGTLWVGADVGLGRIHLSDDPDRPTWWSKTDFPVEAPKIWRFLPTEDALWFLFNPSRSGGAVRYDGQDFRIFTKSDGLPGNGVSRIIQAADDALWFAALNGIGRFDGQIWSRYTRDDGIQLGGIFTSLRETRAGGFWIDDSLGKVIHFLPRLAKGIPETDLASPFKQVSSAGNIFLRWSGRDVYENTHPDDLRYQWRLDEGPWSTWSKGTEFTFTELSTGSHRFEVRAADKDANVDLSPAVHAFVVEPPWWRNPWVVILSTSLLTLASVQTSRSIRRGRRLRQFNADLRSEIAERERAQSESARLDAQLQDLRYLHRLRVALESSRSLDTVIGNAGSVIEEVLADSGSSGVRIHHDARVWGSGQLGNAGQISYSRPLTWGGKDRGRLDLSTTTKLSDSGTRAPG